MAATTDILRANLQAIRRLDPAFADRLAATEPAPLVWAESKAGPLTATTVHAGRTLALASKYDPAAEARKLADEADVQKNPCVVFLGVGLGYHVAEAAGRMKPGDVLVAFEPDLAQLRAVLERVDQTSWLARPGTVLCHDGTDRATLIARFERFAGLATQGTHLVTHPPTRQMHAEAVQRFGALVAETLAYCRTNIATTLVNSARTCFNSACNLGPYAAGDTTDALLGAARGYPAVCVGAGPSLVKNVDLLRDPAVRRNVVVITAQTTLKPLLARGIRPDFVTALDWSAISKRFYEGLPPLPDVTLVVEPKVHPTVVDHFPGPVRMAHSDFNDRILDTLARPRTPMKQGATVAHLSLYLAQHLGCDPIIMIGQDLGFSDGLYYAPGTAIHDVWSSELGPFNTIEMMEWQRIVRHKSHLQRLTDVNGSPIFSDEQMVTYLKQFEKDFAEAVANGQTVIDATEGGLPKADTLRMTLREALSQHATRTVPALPAPRAELDVARLAATAELLTRRVREVTRLKDATDQATPLLRQMLEAQGDRKRMVELFNKLEKITARVQGELQQTFVLVNALNAIGAFKRLKSDRDIAHRGSEEASRQAQQIERDLENMKWLAQACDETLEIFQEARRRITTAAGSSVIRASHAA